jgi:DNA-binding transcriptional regulator YiaG
MNGSRCPSRVSKPALVRQAIEATGLSARGLARLIGCNERTMRRWLAGADEPRGPARSLLRILAAAPETALLIGDVTESP